MIVKATVANADGTDLPGKWHNCPFQNCPAGASSAALCSCRCREYCGGEVRSRKEVVGVNYVNRGEGRKKWRQWSAWRCFRLRAELKSGKMRINFLPMPSDAASRIRL
jgi:hypothetical protein